MLELHAGLGFGGAAWQFYHRHRTPVLLAMLSVAGMATGMAAAASVVQAHSLWNAVFVACGAVLAAGLCTWQTRHLPLAVVTALAPLPGLIWAAPLSGGSNFGAVPLLGYGFGFAVASLRAQTAIKGALNGGVVEYPWRAAAAAVVVAGVLALLWSRQMPDIAGAAFQAVADCGLPALSAFILLPFMAPLLEFDEVFVTRANRVRECRSRVFERVALAAVPRWGLSLTGIVVIFIALGWFGAAPLLPDAVVLLGSSILVVAAAGVVAGGWRSGAAVALVATALCLVLLWAMVVGGREPFAMAGLLQVLALLLLLAFHGERLVQAWRRSGDEPAAARQRVLEEGAGQVFAGAGAAAVLLPVLVMQPGYAVLAMGCVLAAGAATALVPAAVSALETLLPRHRSVEELYGPHQKPRG